LPGEQRARAGIEKKRRTKKKKRAAKNRGDFEKKEYKQTGCENFGILKQNKIYKK
jgi:hypothetical protein